MTSRGKRRNGQPILIKEDMANGLERIPFDTYAYNEVWIQKPIHNNPDILPINEIDTGFTPAISIGREVPTGAGPIDNLFISPDGYLTIVETKLWRNPEARREAVGQILDYAKEANKWTFNDLDNRVKQFNQHYNNNSDGLWATVRNRGEFAEADEQSFIDNVTKNLKRGRFLLLIVGDGIRESVEDMVEYLAQTPQLYFTLALVELQVYNLNQGDSSLIVIPQLVTRTREITRAVVRIEGNYSGDLKVMIEPDLVGDNEKQGYKRSPITKEIFSEELEQKTDKETVEFARQIEEDCEALGLDIEWMAASFTARLPDPQGSGVKIPIFNVDKKGHLNLGLAGPSLKKLQLSRDISNCFAADTAKMFTGIQPRPNREHIWDRDASLGELRKIYPQFMERVKKYVEELTAQLKISSR